MEFVDDPANVRILDAIVDTDERDGATELLRQDTMGLTGDYRCSERDREVRDCRTDTNDARLGRSRCCVLAFPSWQDDGDEALGAIEEPVIADEGSDSTVIDLTRRSQR